MRFPRGALPSSSHSTMQGKHRGSGLALPCGLLDTCPAQYCFIASRGGHLSAFSNPYGNANDSLDKSKPIPDICMEFIRRYRMPIYNIPERPCQSRRIPNMSGPFRKKTDAQGSEFPQYLRAEARCALYRWSTRSRISWVRPWFQYWVPM